MGLNRLVDWDRQPFTYPQHRGSNVIEKPKKKIKNKILNGENMRKN